jgi:hypothetical protein
MVDDLPLILMNMAGMNGNLLSQSNDTEHMHKMKLVFYAVGTLPVELLYSECLRLRCCALDSWIPQEIVHEVFHQKHVLSLNAEGFAFVRRQENECLNFLTVSRSVVWQHEELLHVSGRPEDEQQCFVVKEATPPLADSSTTSEMGWCILHENGGSNFRGARFRITRRDGNKTFLQYDRALRLTRVENDPPKSPEHAPRPNHNFIGRPADPQEEFIIEKDPSVKSLNMSRPQNPEQFNDWFYTVNEALIFSFLYVERYLLRLAAGDSIDNSYWLAIAIYGSFAAINRVWVHRTLRTLVHRVWTETYSPTWNPNGLTMLFWKLSNYEPPFEVTKTICRFGFSFSLTLGNYPAVAVTGMYWYMAYPKEKRELANMFITGFISQAVLWFFF